MSRQRQLTVSANNMTLPPPHPAERYAKLWRALFDLQQPVAIHGDTHLFIASAISLDKKDPTAPIRGSIYRYLEIDKNAQWFNQKTSEFADPKLVKDEVIVPEYLKPNSRAFNYLFIPSAHRLFFESKVAESGTLSPASVEKMLEELCAGGIAAAFPDLHITAEQDATEIMKIVNAEGLRELTITIKRPNPDDDSEDESKLIEKELLEQNAREEIMTLKARRGAGGIKANKRTKALAKVAKSNGRVDARIRTTEGGTKVVSSRTRPLRTPVLYDPKKTTSTAAFEQAAVEIATELKK
jgi:hypothetical protein